MWYDGIQERIMMKNRLINFIAVVLIISGLGFFALYQTDLASSSALNMRLREKKTAAGSESTIQVVAGDESGIKAVTTGEEEIIPDEDTLSVEQDVSEDVFDALRQTWPSKPANPLYGLFLENDDLVGWLNIPNTRIDYPVVRDAGNEYYLKHDFNRSPSKSGSIFMDYRNIGDGSDHHTIIYGHNMKNKTMFYDLLSFRDPEFYSENRILTLETMWGELRYKVFAAYTAGPDFYFITTQFDEASLAEFIREIQARSDYEWDTEVNYSDRILTLTTCSHDFEDSRYVVHAVLIDESPY